MGMLPAVWKPTLALSMLPKIKGGQDGFGLGVPPPILKSQCQ